MILASSVQRGEKVHVHEWIHAKQDRQSDLFMPNLNRVHVLAEHSRAVVDEAALGLSSMPRCVHKALAANQTASLSPMQIPGRLIPVGDLR